MRIAYLVNRYPAVTHSFIRREIGAVEARGLTVFRISIRRSDEPLLDPSDLDEEKRTHVVLQQPLRAIFSAVWRCAAMRPRAMLAALRLAVRIGWRSDRGLPRHLAYLVEACVVHRWLAVWQVEHLHAHFGTNAAAVAMLCRQLGGPPYSFTVHGPEEFERAAGLALAEKMRRAIFVVVVSDFGLRQLSAYCSSSEQPPIHIVHCGLDNTFLSQPPTPVPSARRLVCVGRMCERKGQLLLLEAAARLAAEMEPWELILIGDGPQRREIEARISALGLKGRVTLIGWAAEADVKAHILAARALVLPSFAEGLPVVLMESLALYRPVICTRVAGVPELVEHGGSGWVITPGSVVELSAAMEDALTAPPARLLEMGSRGAQRVGHRHGAATESAKLAALFAASRAGDLPALGSRGNLPNLIGEEPR